MGDLNKSDVTLRTGGSGFPALPSVPGQNAERYDGFDLVCRESSLDPTVAVSDNGGVVLVEVATSLAENAVEEGINHQIAARNTELGKEALNTLARFANEDTAGYRFVLSGILADHKDTSGAIEAAAMKYRPPLTA